MKSSYIKLYEEVTKEKLDEYSETKVLERFKDIIKDYGVTINTCSVGEAYMVLTGIRYLMNDAEGIETFIRLSNEIGSVGALVKVLENFIPFVPEDVIAEVRKSLIVILGIIRK
jgi:biotin transporter BioY